MSRGYITIHLTKPLLRVVRAKASWHSVGCRLSDVVERYEQLIVRQNLSQFTKDELNLLFDIGSGTLWRPAKDVQVTLWGTVARAIELDGRDQQWDVDGHAILVKLGRLSYAETVALVERIERFWSDDAGYESANM